MNSVDTLLGFSLGPTELGLLLVILIFLFGTKKIPEIGKSVGEALTSFKKATKEMNEPDLLESKDEELEKTVS